MTGGANPMFSGDVSMFFASQVQGFREDLAHPIGLLQIVAIGVSFLIAWLLARELHHYVITSYSIHYTKLYDAIIR